MKDSFAKRYFLGSAVITVFLAVLCWKSTPSPALYKKIPLSLFRLLSVFGFSLEFFNFIPQSANRLQIDRMLAVIADLVSQL